MADTVTIDAEYLDLCECRCSRLPGTPTAGQCSQG